MIEIFFGKMNFKRLSMAAMVLLLNSSAIASWEFLGESAKGEVYYFDASTIRKDSIRRGWFLLERKSPTKGEKSEKQLWVAKCKDEQNDLIQYTSYSESMGGGEVVNSNTRSGPPNFSYPPPGSLSESILKKLCE